MLVCDEGAKTKRASIVALILILDQYNGREQRAMQARDMLGFVGY